MKIIATLFLAVILAGCQGFGSEPTKTQMEEFFHQHYERAESDNCRPWIRPAGGQFWQGLV